MLCGGKPCEPTPHTVPSFQDARSLALGARHGCALLAGGSVACFGRNDFGQLGRETADPDPHAEPLPIALQDVTELSAGAEHTCARKSNGEVWCWGLGARGALGDPALLDSCAVPAALKGTGPVPDAATAACAMAPRLVPGVSATRLVSAHASVCAISGRKAWCWGDNEFGQLGIDSTSTSVFSATEVVQPDIVDLALGERHGCAVATDGKTRCWGAHDAGQLGIGGVAVESCSGTACRRAPVLVGDLPLARAVGAAAETTCAALLSGEVRCWGSDSDGQLGDSTTTPAGQCTVRGVQVKCAKAPVAVVPNIVGVRHLVGSGRHMLAVTPDALYSWGANEVGQCTGYGPRSHPELVYGLD